MELMKGYEETTVGVIPSDWQVVPITSLIEKNSRITYGVVQPGKDDPRGVEFIRGGDVYDGKIDEENLRKIPHSVDAQYSRTKLCGGELLISLVGFPGECAIVPVTLKGANIARQVALARLDKGLDFEPDFICHFLRSSIGKKLLLREAFGSAQQVINLKDVNKLELPLPSLLEQRDIATALSDVDALIAGLEKLIVKKRDLKQAAMQQLLTGQTRLPGFSGEWRKTSFSKILRHHAGNSSLIKGKQFDRPMPNLFPGFSASGQDVWCSVYEYEGDAIVVSAVGSRCGKAFNATGKWCAIANTHVIWPDETRIDRRFLSFFVNDEDFWLKSGSGQPFVLFRQTFAREVLLPSIAEQVRISDAISDLEAELTALKNRLSKTRELKQGMMQELLTGRTRLN